MPRVQAIKAFNDNYIWSVEKNGYCALIDPGDSQVCINYLQEQQLKLSAILITHHHRDHTGGIAELLAYSKEHCLDVVVFGPEQEQTGCEHLKLTDGDRISIPGLELEFNVFDVPGHTLGHIAYYNENWLFCGDTLFSGGCGRLFEGSAEQMHSSLAKLASLAPTTEVYCAHEYTSANLTFARAVEPDNQSLINYQQQVQSLRSTNKSTIPSTIGLEKKINPFLRCHEPQIKSSAEHYLGTKLENDVQILKAIRQWKDNF
jgi:hydroxyacylglutathione hydrolase